MTLTSKCEQKEAVLENGVPEHVGIIMDGNRRWAEKRGLGIDQGHAAGARVLQSIVQASVEIGIKVLTVYALSTENWQRSQKELSALFRLFAQMLKGQKKYMLEEGIALHVIGNTAPFSDKLRDLLNDVATSTQTGSTLDLVLALNYGGRDELKRAFLTILQKHSAHWIERHLTENMIAKALDTAKWSNPDLLIRSGGEKRISNFLLWQSAYTEFYFTDVLWPDFGKEDLYRAVLQYQSRTRRRGL